MKGFDLQFDSKGFNAQVKQLTKAYSKLTPQLQKKAIKKGMQLFVKQNKLTATFRSHVPKGNKGESYSDSYKPGGLRKSVGYKVYLYRRTREWVAKVGLMRSKTKQGWRGIFLDEGTQERFVGAGANRSKKAKAAYAKGKLRSVGSIAPQPFGAKAEKSTLSAGRSSFLKHMKEAIDFVTRKIPAKPKKRGR